VKLIQHKDLLQEQTWEMQDASRLGESLWVQNATGKQTKAL